MYYVYFLKQKDKDEIEYVGRTKHLRDRIKAHERSSNRSCLELAGFVRMASYAACRAIEQAAMISAHTLKGAKGKEYNNQINGVGASNPKAGLYYKVAKGVWATADKAADYILNQADNERLNQIEQFIDRGLEKYRSTYSSIY